MDRHLHVMVYGEFVQEPQVRLAARLASLLPASLSVTYFTSSGAEAIDGALKTARKHTGGRRSSRSRAGSTATRGARSRSAAIPSTACRSSRCCRPCGCFRSTTSMRSAAIDERVAAVVVEPVQAKAASASRRRRSWSAPQALRRNRSAARLRRGRDGLRPHRAGLFGFEHWGVVPDLLVLAKALGGGLPLGAFVGRPDVMSTLAHDPPLAHVTRSAATRCRAPPAWPRSTCSCATTSRVERDRLGETSWAAACPRRPRRRTRGPRPRDAHRHRVRRSRRHAPAFVGRPGTARSSSTGRSIATPSSVLAPPLVLTDAEAEQALATIARCLA
jgi:hypothetical protein